MTSHLSASVFDNCRSSNEKNRDFATNIIGPGNEHLIYTNNSYFLNCKFNDIDPSILPSASVHEQHQQEKCNYLCIVLMGKEEQAQHKDEINSLGPDIH